MSKLVSRTALLILASMLLAKSASLAQEPTADELDIRSQIGAWETAWNQGDARIIAEFYDEDAERTYAHGITRSGKGEIYELYRQAFSADLPEGVEQTLNLKILSVRLLTSEVAVVDYAYQATGIPIAPFLTVDGRATVVMVLRKGKWLRSVQRNWIPTTPECMRTCQKNVSNYPPQQKE